MASGKAAARVGLLAHVFLQNRTCSQQEKGDTGGIGGKPRGRTISSGVLQAPPDQSSHLTRPPPPILPGEVPRLFTHKLYTGWKLQVTTDTLGCGGSGTAGPEELSMEDNQPSSLNGHHSSSETKVPSEPVDQEDAASLQRTVFESRRSRDSTKSQDLDDRELGFEVQEEEALPEEEVNGEEFLDTQNPEEVLSGLESVLEKDMEEDVPEMSQLSISQGSPSTPKTRCRKRRRICDLARPKVSWQVLRDRKAYRCKGFTWVSPRMKSLQFCVYWPSVYWTEKFLEDTTLTVTVPAVSRRVEELARPKRFYSEYYNSNRTTPVWPVPRSTLEYQTSGRLRELATPRVRNNIWSINMSEVSQVSRAAQMAVPSRRILWLAKPKVPATLLEEWDPMPKPKPHVSDHNRLLQLARPKAQSDKCVPDRDPRWKVLDSTKKAVASPRILSLAQPKVRKDLNEGYDPFSVSPASLAARASPRLFELATPKSVAKRA
ncbi:PREDICTED: testicular haploid expressed gene protein [Condylura cristata]|uniref:testicular haploid expressed gene protein n=1 Tax=Condylura cristata TaxID=143302 RepID=UPI0003344495|nr:PREDICTED: testicular haploid expressed gene protein [Condylura cristata]